VAVDGAVVDVDLVVVGRVHERVAALHDARALGNSFDMIETLYGVGYRFKEM
jgi:DNA-binding response OmpR family regulator